MLQYSLFVNGVFTKYAWVKPFKDRKAKTVFHSFVKVANESKR